MKRLNRNALLVALSVILLSALSLAQDATYQVNVDIPFEFSAAAHQFPAGAYQFSVNYETHAVTLRSKQSGQSFVLFAIPDDGDKDGQAFVEFDVANGSYSLADLKTANAGVDFSQHRSTVTAARNVSKVAILATLR